MRSSGIINKPFLSIKWSFISLLIVVASAQSAQFDFSDLENYCSSKPSDDTTWVCFFSLDPTTTCRQTGESGSFQIVTRIEEVQALSKHRIAYINVSECSSLLPNRLPPDLLSEFEHVVIGINAEGNHAHSCPDVHVLTAIFPRINHSTRCLILLNISQDLLENTQNLDRFNGLQDFVLLNSSFTTLTPSVLSFLQTSNVERVIIRNTGLESFELNFQNLNQSLKYVDLSNNSLTRFEIDSNVSLARASFINLAYNKLFLSPKNLRFDHTTTTVDLSSNGLRSLQDLEGQMLKLNASNNKISEIKSSTFANIEALSVLDLSNNELTSLPDQPLGAHLSLVELYLSRNKISLLPERVFANATLLTTIDLSFNNLEFISAASLNFSRLPMLQYLDLRNNRLVKTPSIEPFSDAITVMLSSNLLQNLSVLPTKFNRKLTVIAINNSISDFKKINIGMYQRTEEIDRFLWDPSFYPNWASPTTKRAISVDISANLIQNLDAHIFMAYLLIKPFNHFGVVSFYNLTNNPLICSCDMLNRVQYLAEAYNVSKEHKITPVVEQASSLLKATCRIKDPNARDYSSTKSSNQDVLLAELSSESMKRQLKCSDDPARCPEECFCSTDRKMGMKKADCAECDCLHEMPASMPPNTSVIHFEGNFIKTLGCKRYLRDVRQLFMQNNLVDTIEECVYRFLQNVDYLRLDSNHIIRFPYKLAYLPGLTMNESIHLENNSFSCECSEDVRDAFDHFGSRLAYPENIECHTEDGVGHSYLHFLDHCDSPAELRVHSNSPSGVQLLLLVVMSAIVIVVLIIIFIVIYYVCCTKYVVTFRRNMAKLMLRLAGKDENQNANNIRYRPCSINCFTRLRNSFRFTPLAADEELIVENEENDPTAEFVRQMNCESGIL